MKIDFKKELETATKGMIMIHDPNLLIKLILRMIVRKLGVKHSGMILFDPDHETYVLNISKGKAGLKIPQGFARFDNNSPLIKVFRQRKYRSLLFNRHAIVAADINRLIWRESLIDNGRESRQGVEALLQKVEDQMDLFNVSVCVPAYYRNKLMAVLLLGEKYDGEKFEQEEIDFFAALASDAAMAIRNAQLFGRLKSESERNRKLFLQTINVLGATIEAKDAYTQGHTERVTKYAIAIARQMEQNGSWLFEKNFFDNLYLSGMLHDIGKIAIPEVVLNKQGKLTEEEYAQIKQHTLRGVEIVASLKLDLSCIQGIKNHHERYDGKGYPQGLKGENIPIIAAIISVADTFDAMTTTRSYRKGLDEDFAISEIRKESGIQFNPLPVQAIVELFEGGLI